MQRTQLAAALLAAFSPVFVANALASTSPQLPPAEFTLEEIVVTATRTARTADETLAAVTVISRQDIERTQAQSVQEVLAGQSGLAISNSGGAGKATSVFLRGTQPGHVLVLIDGIKVGSATSGSVAFQDIPVEAIERIEIVRGPLSSLYGSEALGGVIQIFTRKGGGEAISSASLMLGNYNTQKATAHISGGGENAWFNMAASYFNTEGFNACKGSLSSACYTVEPDKDGYRNNAVNLRGGHRFKPGTELDVHLLRAEGKNEYDGTSSNESEPVQLALGASLKHRINDVWNTRLALGQSRDESDAFLNGVYKSTFNTRRDTSSWQNDFDLGLRRLLTLGVDYQEDTVTSTTNYTVKNRDNTGVFAQFMAGVGTHDFKFSLRRDDNSQFGGHTTGNAAWGMDIRPDLRGRLGYGTAFNAPTFNQLYYPGFGNPALLPEESESLEAGLSGHGALGQWSATLFDNRITNLISFDGTTNPSNASARIRGLEADWKIRLADWDVRTNLTLQDPENTSNTANKGKVLNRRAEQSLRLDLERRFGAWNLGGTFRAEGRRYDNLANTTKLAGYGLLDLHAETRLAKDWRFQAKVENLFNKTYETVAGYNQPGRGLYLTLRYQPGK